MKTKFSNLLFKVQPSLNMKSDKYALLEDYLSFSDLCSYICRCCFLFEFSFLIIIVPLGREHFRSNSEGFQKCFQYYICFQKFQQVNYRCFNVSDKYKVLEHLNNVICLIYVFDLKKFDLHNVCE